MPMPRFGNPYQSISYWLGDIEQVLAYHYDDFEHDDFNFTPDALAALQCQRWIFDLELSVQEK